MIIYYYIMIIHYNITIIIISMIIIIIMIIIIMMMIIIIYILNNGYGNHRDLRNAWCWSAHCAATSASPSCRRSRRRAPLRLPWRPEPATRALSVGRSMEILLRSPAKMMVFCWFLTGVGNCPILGILDITL